MNFKSSGTGSFNMIEFCNSCIDFLVCIRVLLRLFYEHVCNASCGFCSTAMHTNVSEHGATCGVAASYNVWT